MTTLIIHKEEDEQRQLKVTVDVAEERVQKAMREKANQLGREIKVPGFRPGKVPYNVIVRRIGKEALRQEAIEDLIDPIFTETLQEVDVQPYAQPHMEDIELEPLKFTFTFPLEPSVDLGDYREIRREMPAVEITDEAVDDALEHIRKHHEVIEPVDRPVEIGDQVTYSGTGRYTDADGEEHTIFEEERNEALMDSEVLFPGTPFVENLVGLEVGDQKEFSFTFAEDYEDEQLAGREATFEITILDVQMRELPELDDDLAKLEGNYETLEDLRVALRERLESQAENQARDDFFDAMIEDLKERATIVYPPAALEAELDKLVEEMRNQMKNIGWQWEDFLRLQGRTEDDLRESWHDQAETRLLNNLILLNFMKQEKIVLGDERLEQEIEERLKHYEDEELRQEMRDYLLGEHGFPSFTSGILMTMVLERMEAIAAGTAPDLSESELEAAPLTEAENDEVTAVEQVEDEVPDGGNQTALADEATLEEAVDEVDALEASTELPVTITNSEE